MLKEKRIDQAVAHIPDSFVVLKAASGAGWRRAKRARAVEARQDAASMMAAMPADIFDRITSKNDEVRGEATRQLEELEYHPDNVDHGVLLRECVTEWWLGEVPDDPSEEIDAATTLSLVKECIALTRPPTEEEEGNFLPPSPSISSATAQDLTSGT